MSVRRPIFARAGSLSLSFPSWLPLPLFPDQTMENVFVSVSRFGVCRRWEALARRLGHKVLEPEDAHPAKVKAVMIERAAKAKTVYAVGNLVDGKVLGDVGLLLEGAHGEAHLFDQRSQGWWRRVEGSWHKVEGKPPRPSGLWTGVGGIAVTPEGLKAIESLLEQK